MENKKQALEYWEASDYVTLPKQLKKQLLGSELSLTTTKITIEMLEEMLGEDHHSRILEVGCGWGRLMSTLKASRENTILGLDFSRSMLSLAREILNPEKHIETVPLMVGDAEQLPFRSSTFDFLYSVRVLQYVNNPLKVLKEFKRVVKQNGKVVVILPNKWNPFRALTYHTRLFSPNTIEDIFTTLKFRDISVGFFGFSHPHFFKNQSHAKKFEIIRRISLLKNFGAFFRVIGTK